MLLEREDLDPNKEDIKYGWTPLLWAAEKGRSAVVKMLLEREDVNPNRAENKYGATPLSWAVFATGQSVRPGAGRRGTAFGGPVRSFSKLTLRPGAKDYKPRRPLPSSVKHVSCQATRPN